MVAIRIMLAVVISLGLALTPVAAAIPAKKSVQPMSTMVMHDDCPHQKAATKHQTPCPADGQMGVCDGDAFCALKCFKIVAVFHAPMAQYWVKSRIATVDIPPERTPVSWRPSPPPPRH